MVGFCISRREERIGWTRKTVSWVSLREGKVSHDQEMASNLAKFYHLLRNVTQEKLITALLRWQRTFWTFFSSFLLSPGVGDPDARWDERGDQQAETRGGGPQLQKHRGLQAVVSFVEHARHSLRWPVSGANIWEVGSHHLVLSDFLAAKSDNTYTILGDNGHITSCHTFSTRLISPPHHPPDLFHPSPHRIHPPTAFLK